MQRLFMQSKPSPGGGAPGTGVLQRRESAQKQPAAVPPIIHDVLRSPGQPLDAETRAYMEPRFGHDFSKVRVHTDARAAESARAVNAQAYTVGRDVAFGAGQFAPASPAGLRLLAHELAHTVQQRGAGSNAGPELRIEPPGSPGEREADDLASKIAESLPGAAADPAVPNVAAGAMNLSLQRKVIVNPKAGVEDILGQFNTICPGGFTNDRNEIKATTTCGSGGDAACVSSCETASDTKRTYTIRVSQPKISRKSRLLWDGTRTLVPLIDENDGPATDVGSNPDITMPSSSSKVEFGIFDQGGKPLWVERWRLLAHELLGHGLKRQKYTGERIAKKDYPGGTKKKRAKQDAGNRRGHDETIATENEIAGVIAGRTGEQPSIRGSYDDTRQGEAFYNPAGNRSKVVFWLKDGLHYEPP